MDQIKKLRNEIDILDNKIMELLDTRYKISKQIGEVKATQNIQVLDSNREDLILSKTTKFSHSPQIYNIYKTIMKESKSLQRK